MFSLPTFGQFFFFVFAFVCFLFFVFLFFALSLSSKFFINESYLYESSAEQKTLYLLPQTSGQLTWANVKFKS